MGSELVSPYHGSNGQGIALSGDGNVLAMFYSDSAGSRVLVSRWNGSGWVRMGADISPLDSDGAGEPLVTDVGLNAAGDVVVIGAPSSLNGLAASGRVHVYRWNGSGWVPKGSPVPNPNPSSSWDFGKFVGVSGDGNRFVQGCASTQAGGFASIHSWTGSSWALQRSFLRPGTDDRDGVGASISSDGNVVVFGRRTEDGRGAVVRAEGSSSPVVFQEPNGVAPEFVVNNPDSVSLSGDGRRMCVVRSSYVATDGSVVPGGLEVHEWSGGSWTGMGPVMPRTGPGTGVLRTGVLNHDGLVRVGEGRVWRWDGSAWVQKGSSVTFSHPQFGALEPDFQAVNYDGTVVAHAIMTNVYEIRCRVYRWN